MKNVIVYSINTLGEQFNNSDRLRQLVYSVSRLRRFNNDIDVCVYISDKNFSSHEYKYKKLNITFKYFDLAKYKINNLDYNNSKNAEKLWHRWTNTFDALKSSEYDNALYIDTDTIFYNDPEKLFSIYGNTNSIYTKEDNCYDIMKTLGVENNGLNAGQILFSKFLLNTEKDMFLFMEKYIDSKLLKIKDQVSKESYNQTLWVIDQYALYEYYKSIGVQTKIYDTKHVMLHLEPWVNDVSELVLHHYLNRNYKIAVPSEFVYDDISERFL